VNQSEDAPSPVIEPSANGPYVVKNLRVLKNSKGEHLPTKDVVALCRCGGSQNKPFCDGTHARNKFSSQNRSDPSQNKRTDYVGRQITIHDNRAICAHAGRCTDALPSVWRMGIEPWIDPDAAAVNAIIETIEQCPSGALGYSIAGVEHHQNHEPTVTISPDGPYVVTGGIELKDAAWGEGASTEHYTLCRCGASNNKPFCDGAHWRIKFKDEKN